MQIKRALAGTALSLGLIGGLASPATAAGAQPVKGSGQFTGCYFLDEDVEICSNETFTTKIIDMGRGGYLAQVRGTFTETITEDGLVDVFTSQFSGMEKFRAGEEQIFRVRSSGQFGSCTFDFKFLVVKGVVKQSVDNFQCEDGEGGEIVF